MSDPPSLRLRVLLALLLAANLVGAGVALARDDSSAPVPPIELPTPDGDRQAPQPSPDQPGPATRTASRFLDRYLDEDGRVVRRDQGGDTVSEGQAYGLLAAVGVGDRERFDLIRQWTLANLQRPDGLLSWRWAGGAVVDPEPAADADLDAAWALTLAAERWPDGPYLDDARTLVTAILEHETVELAGEVHLAAGPWAVGELSTHGSVVTNPSYPSPVATSVLVEAGVLDPSVGSSLAVSHRSVVAALVADHGAPTNWARVGAAGEVRAIASPTDGQVGGFGWDAVRVPLRLASSCQAADTDLAAGIWPAVEAGAGVEAMGDHPARLIGAAAAASSAGHLERALSLLAEAEAGSEAAPTYYGDALVAIGNLLLTTDALGGCPPL